MNRFFEESAPVTKESWDAMVARLGGKKWSKTDRMNRWSSFMFSQAAALPCGVFIPIRTENQANARVHWRTRSRQAKKERTAAHSYCIMKGLRKAFPVTVKMTRFGPKPLDKGCGVNGALKSTRDGVADYFGRDDGDEESYVWEYAQKRSPAGCYGVLIQFIYKMAKPKRNPNEHPN